MTLREAAQIYVDFVKLEELLLPDDWQGREGLSVLRSKYHDLLSEEFRRAGIICSDRFEVTRKAFELVGEPSIRQKHTKT